MTAFHKPHQITQADFSQHMDFHFEKVSQTHQAQVITRESKPPIVLVSADVYEELVWEAEERRLDMQLKASLEAYDRGERGRPYKEVMEELRAEAFERRAKA
jgi:prevent-host-death family protein